MSLIQRFHCISQESHPLTGQSQKLLEISPFASLIAVLQQLNKLLLCSQCPELFLFAEVIWRDGRRGGEWEGGKRVKEKKEES